MTAPTQTKPDTNQVTEVYTRGMIALIPADPYPDVLAVPGGLPKDQLHLTLAYLGDDVTSWPPELGVAVRQAVREITGAVPPDDDQAVMVNGPGAQGPLTLTVFAHSHFNPTGADGREPCMVYQFSGDGDLPAVESLAGEVQYRVKDEIGEVNFPDQHERFEPHVTAGYGIAPTVLSYTGPVVFDRIRVQLGDQYTDIPLGGDSSMTAAAPTAPTEATTTTAAPIQVLADTGNEIKVKFPVFALEGMDTRDNGGSRYITPGKLDHSALPLSLMGQPYTSHGGQEPPPAEVMGKITDLTRHAGPDVMSPRTGKPYPADVWVWSAEGAIDGNHRFADLVRKQYMRGVSADLAGMDAELVDDATASMSEHPHRRVIVNSAEIAGGTMVPIAAFGDAYCELSGDAAIPEPLAASAFPEGMFLDPQPMWRSAEIGDLVAPTKGGSVTAQTRKRATAKGHALPVGSFPVETADDLGNAIHRSGSATRIPDSWKPDGTVEDKESMTAAAAARRPPLAWFTDPGFTGETPITISDDGHVYGHVAVWSRPHIGFNGQTIYARPSRADYAFFNTGAVRCVDGDGTTRIAAVGHLTMGTGHADLHASYTAAARHYDHTGYAWADVAAGDDQYGVWVNGILKPGITDEQISYAYAHPPSGDWRPIDGGLELVAALCVNTPGIPVSRARVASGEVVALVAAGALAPEPRGGEVTAVDYDQLADVIATKILDRQARVASLSHQQASLVTELDDSPQRMAKLLAEFPDDSDLSGFSSLVQEIGEPTIVDVSAATDYLSTDDGSLAKQNWVQKSGGLPQYIKRIAKHLQEKGKDESTAIATAVNAAKKMCSTGDLNWPGMQQVNPGSKAEACAAVAEWERKKTQSHAS